MTKHEIPQHQWAPFLESFSLEHAGKLISVQSHHPQLGIVIEVENKPLAALIEEAEPELQRIAIVFDQSALMPSSHFVCAPRQIRLCLTPEGIESGVEIDDSDGNTVVVQFSQSASLGIEAA